MRVVGCTHAAAPPPCLPACAFWEKKTRWRQRRLPLSSLPSTLSLVPGRDILSISTTCHTFSHLPHHQYRMVASSSLCQEDGSVRLLHKHSDILTLSKINSFLFHFAHHSLCHVAHTFLLFPSLGNCGCSSCACAMCPSHPSLSPSPSLLCLSSLGGRRKGGERRKGKSLSLPARHFAPWGGGGGGGGGFSISISCGSYPISLGLSPPPMAVKRPFSLGGLVRCRCGCSSPSCCLCCRLDTPQSCMKAGHDTSLCHLSSPHLPARLAVWEGDREPSLSFLPLPAHCHLPAHAWHAFCPHLPGEKTGSSHATATTLFSCLLSLYIMGLVILQDPVPMPTAACLPCLPAFLC